VYIAFFLIWPLRLVRVTLEWQAPAAALGAIFIAISQAYMVFSFVGGIRSALKERPIGVVAIAAILCATILLLSGEFLWCTFAGLWLMQVVSSSIWRE
jgi:hypothetical protein